MGGFVILDGDGKEVIRARHYYGPGQTNNEAENFVMWDAVHCLQSPIDPHPDLRLPVSIFGNSQLLIRFMLQIYKKPSDKPSTGQSRMSSMPNEFWADL